MAIYKGMPVNHQQGAGHSVGKTQQCSMYLPLCSEEDKRAAAVNNVCIIEAKEKPGYDPIDWLATIPRDHQMDFVIGHGIHLGRQVPLIKEVHQECKWIQVVHTDPEEHGMFKNSPDSIAKGERKHQAEVKLCELADQVVAIGPKLAEAFSSYSTCDLVGRIKMSWI